MTNTDVQPASRVPGAKGTGSKSTRATQLRKLLARKNGATIAQLQKVFNWQPHTARAAISSLRKAGAVIERTDSPKGSVYRIAQEDVVQ
ncbi:MAG: DUF3489 domain-containing protein [Maritimibacter sp.]|jgi:Fic family protein